MNANELMIGNWVIAVRFGIEIPATIENGVDIQSVIMNPELYKGILLTTEILTKSGFDEVLAREGVLRAFKFKGIRIEMSNSGNFYYKTRPLNHVHKMQNLFTVLGLELKIEL